MNIQHMPLDYRAQAQANAAAGKELSPPSFGEAQRGAIDSVVTSLSNDLFKRIESLRSILAKIEQQMLASAEQSKARLEKHVSVCVRIDDEIRAMQIVVDDLAKDAAHEP